MKKSLFIFLNISLCKNPVNIPKEKKFYKIKSSSKIHLISKIHVEEGLCSYYSNKFHGNKTSTGDIYSNDLWTCAHKTLPAPSVILVTFLHNKKIKGVKLLVNDRGPFIKNRIIDVSMTVAKEMGIVNKGLIKVVIFLLRNETKALLKTKKFFPIERLLDLEEINNILKIN
jgi:rare lipoprotein A